VSGAPYSGAFYGLSTSLAHKYKTGLKKLACNKHSSLFCGRVW